MNYNLFVILILGSVLECMYDIFITNRLSEKEAKKCKYICDNCSNFKCYKKYCDRKRKEIEEKRKK